MMNLVTSTCVVDLYDF